MVDGFGVAVEAGEGFEGCGVGAGGGGRGPEVDGGVVGGGNEAFGEGVVDGGGGFEAGEGGGEFGVFRGGDEARVGVVGGAEDGVGGEGEVVDPVGVRGEGVRQGTGGGGPDLDGFVVRGGIDVSGAAPADARNGAFVAGEDEVDAFGDDVPDSDGGVFGSGGETRSPGGLEVVWFPTEAADPFGVAL